MTGEKVARERWRTPIEDYVPAGTPDAQAATAETRAPFATYLNQMHRHLHPYFAESFLESLSQLPASDPLSHPELKVTLEIVLDAQGQLVRSGVVQPSGVVAFDIGALEAVSRAQPFGEPPHELLSADRQYYMHWELHRAPNVACATYFAQPFLLKTGQ